MRPPHHRPLSPLGSYLRHRLQRRLFWWFGVNILVTGIAVAVVMKTVNESSGTGPEWRQAYEGGVRFLGEQFEKQWDDPAARLALARQLHADVHTPLRLVGARGEQLLSLGTCEGRKVDVPVFRGPSYLGRLELCPAWSGPRNAWRFIVPLVIALLMLWAASGRLARRLSRPLSELAKVAAELGGGNLKARVQLPPKERGEVVVVADAVNDMAARIEKQLQDQRELLAAVSHELRTPLQRIRLITEIARGGAAPDPKMLDSLDQEVIELDALVGDLLATSRLDFGQLTPRALDAADVARRALERAGLPAEAYEGPASLTFEGDATLIARALANLLENARRHGLGAKVLRVRGDDPKVTFEVDDAGAGFQPGEAERAFDPFFRRPKTTDAEAASLGLGLALVKRIAEAHRGRAFAGNRPEGGARVGMEIPRIAAAPDSPSASR